MKRIICCLLALSMIAALLPGFTVSAASEGPAALTTPDIEPVDYAYKEYVGYYDDVVSCSSSLKIRWEDVDADFYNVAVKLLDGEPNPGQSESGTSLFDYTTEYAKTYISLTQADMESAAGKWIKVFVQPSFSGTVYSCHYYFQVEEKSAGSPAALTNPDIEPALHSSGEYIGYYDDVIPYSSSLRVRWEDVDADFYNVAVKVLDGEPNPGQSEAGTFLFDYTTEYTKKYISLTQADMESAAGKWVKVFVQPSFSGTVYSCHYYFQVEEKSAGSPAALTNPDIEPVLHSSGDYVGYYDDIIPNSSSLKVRWEDVGADYYNVAVKVLNGEPDPCTSEDGTFLFDYTTEYTETYISLTQADMESAAGKWVKLFVQSVFGSETYACHYYFPVETAEDSLILNKSSVSLAWDESSEDSVQITGTDSYTYTVAYDVPDSVKNSEYNYEWLNAEENGTGLVFTPNRANYSASARTATVTVTAGSESKTVTVTQEACGEAAPTIQLHRGTTVYADGDTIGTFTLPQEAMEVDITSTNVRKVTAYLLSDAGNELDSCTSTSKISLDISNVPAGKYKIVIYASNSDTANDYWKQSPFANGSMTLHFGLKDLTLASSKDFASFDEAMGMVELTYSDDWSTVGKIQYIEQRLDAESRKTYYYTDANADGITRTEGYWTDDDEASGTCTRAASCMAWSYMGITAFPKHVAPTNHPYKIYANTLGCDVVRDNLSLAEFEQWYERYASDTTGQYSPIILHTYYDTSIYSGAGYHAFTIFGRDINDGYYYVIDPGTNGILGKVQIVEVNGLIRIADYIAKSGNDLEQYHSGYEMLSVWQYINNNAPTPPSTPLEVSKTTAELAWGKDTEDSIQVSGVDSYTYTVAYDVPDSVLNSEYNYEWLNCERSGNTLILTPNRANYAAEARTAVVTVTSGSESKAITVTQAACGEASPTIELYSDNTVYANGDFLGSFQLPKEAVEVSIASANVQKVSAYLFNSADETLEECTDTDVISFDVSALPAGQYSIIVYASNSDTANDYWKQSPFANGSMTLSFELVAVHEHSYESIVTGPTCTQQGYTTYLCAECGDSYNDTYIDALGHSYGSWEVSKEAACTEKGEQKRTCVRCEEAEVTEIPSTGHNYQSAVTSPTCTEGGYTAHTCRCGDSYIDSQVPAQGHAEVIDTAVDATCTEAGLTEGKHCSVCNAVLIVQTKVSAKGHDYVTVVTMPTCTKQGYTTYTCSTCADCYQADDVAALGHSFGEWQITMEASCTTDGEQSKTCTACDLTEIRDIPATGHKYSDGTCVNCNAKDPSAILKGDANNDGTVDNVDAMLLLQYTVGLLEYELTAEICDVNNDNMIDNVDAMLILQFSVGLIGSFG